MHELKSFPPATHTLFVMSFMELATTRQTQPEIITEHHRRAWFDSITHVLRIHLLHAKESSSVTSQSSEAIVYILSLLSGIFMVADLSIQNWINEIILPWISQLPMLLKSHGAYSDVSVRVLNLLKEIIDHIEIEMLENATSTLNTIMQSIIIIGNTRTKSVFKFEQVSQDDAQIGTVTKESLEVTAALKLIQSIVFSLSHVNLPEDLLHSLNLTINHTIESLCEPMETAVLGLNGGSYDMLELFLKTIEIIGSRFTQVLYTKCSDHSLSKIGRCIYEGLNHFVASVNLAAASTFVITMEKQIWRSDQHSAYADCVKLFLHASFFGDTLFETQFMRAMYSIARSYELVMHQWMSQHCEILLLNSSDGARMLQRVAELARSGDVSKETELLHCLCGIRNILKVQKQVGT